jgi:tetratricopeptide (TPR) repeat protein
MESRNAQRCNFAFTARAISDCSKPAVQFLGSSFRNCTHTHRDHSESYCHALPRALGNGKAVAVALEFYRDGFAISELGTKDDPNNTESQHDLAIAYERIGTVLVKIGHLSEALASYRDSLAIVTAQVAKNDSNKWHDDLQVIIEEVGGLSYSFLPARDFVQALAASDLAISLAPNMTWVYSNRAHALMFLGRVEEARSVYLKHRGEIAVDDKVWETVILEDFGNFRKAGLTHPLMRVIETALSQ